MASFLKPHEPIFASFKLFSCNFLTSLSLPELKTTLLWIRIWLKGMLWLVWSPIQATKIFYIPANKVFHFLLFWLHHTTCGILVSWPGIEPGPSAVTAWSPNHWMSREFPVPLSYSCVHWNSTFNLLQELFIHIHSQLGQLAQKA